VPKKKDIETDNITKYFYPISSKDIGFRSFKF